MEDVMRGTRQRTRRAIALGLASAALGTAFSLGSPGAAMAQPIPPSGPSQSGSSVAGSSSNPQPAPQDMRDGLDFWRDMGWPNWHNIAGREWFTASAWVDPATHRQHREMIFTGGQYQDRDGALRSFMHAGHAGTSSTAMHYMGSFQEYNTTIYTGPVNSAVPRRDARRLVRAVNTGDVWWTDDHYSTFHYMGRP
ncbi:hypothetical protein [Streptomyces viridochromogenes]|uniref:hypothetical protein n=1 Tax=Streptomyces viridochromogenes TaxID=1938 RepID=UPI00069EF18D|nr:hypothetical protein [Streptomyces viridochromogenes]KOG11427.1 hypothetical protein ADK36_36960 [Streptomyces viridochromogenes]KOG11979.1 hypothetical protein ADK35_35315 [Streptomyces viridochromogenes]